MKDSADQSVQDAVEAEVDRRLAEVSFTSDEDADKLVGTFSGGMKRKILIAVALLGDPEVVFLDGTLVIVSSNHSFHWLATRIFWYGRKI